MKPAAFDYHAPATSDEALALLDRLGAAARPLAGGQSLVPLMNVRAEQPEVIVDLNGIGELDAIARDGDWLSIGALTRERTVERSPEVALEAPLLQIAVRHIAYPAIRNRGTVGGSVAHADPSAEIVCALLALDARVVLRSASGRRELPVEDFVLAPYVTAREPSELLTEIRIPPAPEGARPGFGEVAHKASDFALALACAVVAIDDGVCTAVRLAVGGSGTIAARCRAAEAHLAGRALTAEAIREAGEIAAGELGAADSHHGTAAYKRQIFKAQAVRALARASWPEVDLTGALAGEGR